MTTTTGGCIGVVLLVLSTGCSLIPHAKSKEQAHERWSEVRAQIRFQLAAQQLDAGHVADAARSAGEAIALDPTLEGAFITRARAQLEEGAIEPAWMTLQAARAVGHDSAALAYTEGVTLEQWNKTDRALAQYHAARTRKPDNADYLIAEAESLVALDRSHEALTLLHENEERFNGDAGFYLLTGRIAAMLGDLETATAHYRSASALAPENTEIQASYGLVLARARQYPQAATQLEPLLKRADDMAGFDAVRRALATCYLDRGDATAARSVLEPYANGQTTDARALLLLAKAAIVENDTFVALRYVDAARRQMPDSTEVWLLRALVQWRRDDLAGATDSLYTVLAHDPDDVDAHCMLGDVLLEQDAAPTARTCFRRALALDPTNPWAAARLRALDDDLSDLGSG